MEDTEKYSLGKNVTAEAVYGRLEGKRQAVVDTGRLMAELTIPSVFPPEGYQAGDRLPGNNQSIGAQCVNTLASHLMLLAFPPSQPIYNSEIKEAKLRDDIEADPELWSKTELALSRLEMAHRTGLASTTLATTYTGYIKALLIGGNALWKHLRLGNPTFHLPTSYVVKRNKMGLPLLSIHKETIALMGMDRDHVDYIMARADPEQFKDQNDWEWEVDVYSVCRLRTDDQGDHTWCYWEEWEGNVLPDTEVETDFDVPPMWPGWMIPVFGDDWGRSYCEEYRGDLFSVESFSSGMNDGMAMAVLSLMFVRPGSATSLKTVREAKNLAVLSGDAADVTVFRTDKSADLNAAGAHLEGVARRLSAAFLTQASIQRNGERVTAEEIKRLGHEVDKGMGGLYTQTAQSHQRYIILRAIRLHEDTNKDIPELPLEYMDIRISTGLDALGQSSDAENLEGWAGTMKTLFPKQSEVVIDAGDFGRRLASYKGIKPDGLVKSPERVAQEAQQQKQDMLTQQVVDKAAGPATKGLMDAMSQQQGAPQDGGQ